MSDERVEHSPQEFVSVLVGGTYVFIGVNNRADFDQIALPVRDAGENENGHVLTKSLEQHGVTVVFQYWLKSLTIAAMHADHAKRRTECAAPAGEAA